MSELTRRQVVGAAAWSVPVVAIATAAPASAASGDTDYCGCFLPAAMTFDQGRWTSKLAPDGVSWHAFCDLQLQPCAGVDDFRRQHGELYVDFVVSQIAVQTTEGGLGGISSSDMLGQRVSGSLPISTDMHFVSADWDIGSSASHHVTSVDATVQVRLTNGSESFDQVCPSAMKLHYTFGPDEYGNWEGNSGIATVAIA